MASLSVPATVRRKSPLSSPTFFLALEAVLQCVWVKPGMNVSTIKKKIHRETMIDATVVAAAVNIARLDGYVRVERGGSDGILLFPKAGVR